VLDRSINTMASIYRDISVIQNDAEDAAGLINLENRDAITDLASRLTREGAVQRMDAIATARRRLNGNGNQLLDFEALLCALIV
jgi:DNA polymerase III subunit delta'